MLSSIDRTRPTWGAQLALVLCLICFGTWAATSLAQTFPVVPEVVAPLPAGEAVAPVAETYDTGSIAWMLTSSALVLLMVPGLALFYGGMVRAKNVLNMFLCCMVAIGVIGLHWVIIGYAIAFPVVTDATSIFKSAGGGDLPIVSWLAFDKSLMFLHSFTAIDYGRLLTSGDTVGAINTRIPELAFVMFQGKFAIITPALIVGALAERVRFGPFIIFMLIWSTFVYCPVAHWVWNVNGWLFQYGVLDFAGGTVVHVLGGVSALAICLVLGPRTGYGKIAMPPHSLGLTLIGAGFLWFGWFGFNAGSAVALPGADLPVAGKVAALAFTNTQIAAAAAATVWMFIEWFYAGKPTILGFASGLVAGLVVITPCAGHVLPWHSIVIGGLGGFACFFACKIKHFIKADDSLDAFGLHGVGGAIGALLVGVFAFRPVEGGWDQFLKQLLGVSVCAVFAFVATFVIAFVIQKTIGLRVTPEEELEGLDITLHGESGYILSDTFTSSVNDIEGIPDARATTAHAH